MENGKIKLKEGNFQIKLDDLERFTNDILLSSFVLLTGKL